MVYWSSLKSIRKIGQKLVKKDVDFGHAHSLFL